MQFFITRPVFAAVLSVLITLGRHARAHAAADRPVPGSGAAAGGRHRHLPRGGRPDRSETVAAPIEEQVNGVEGMMYMESQAPTTGPCG